MGESVSCIPIRVVHTTRQDPQQIIKPHPTTTIQTLIRRHLLETTIQISKLHPTTTTIQTIKHHLTTIITMEITELHPTTTTIQIIKLHPTITITMEITRLHLTTTTTQIIRPHLTTTIITAVTIHPILPVNIHHPLITTHHHGTIQDIIQVHHLYILNVVNNSFV
jgi:hypothetical protein